MLRRWRRLRPRGRAALASLVMMTLLVGAGLAARWWGEAWPARAVLDPPGDTWPLAFSPDGRAFLTFGRGGILPWDVASARRGEPWAVKEGWAAVSGAFSPDGKTFAAVMFHPSRPLTIELYDAATGRPRATLDTTHQSNCHLAFDADGQTIRAFLAEHLRRTEVVTWDVATGREVARRPLTASTQSGITAFSRIGRILAVKAPRATTIQLWDLDADRDLGTVADPNATVPIAWGGMGLSEDGRILAAGREDGTIELWDVPARRFLKAIPAHANDFSSSMIRFSPDGRTLASTGHRWGPRSTLRAIQDDIRRKFGSNPNDDSEVVVLDLATGRRVASATDAMHPIYSPDGRTLATREQDGSVKLRSLPRSTR